MTEQLNIVKNSSCKQDNWPNTTDSGFYTFDFLNRIPALYRAQNGKWIEDSSEFRFVPSMSSRDQRNSEGSLLTYLLIAEQGASLYQWALSADGILTVTESGSDSNPVPTPKAKRKAAIDGFELVRSGDPGHEFRQVRLEI